MNVLKAGAGILFFLFHLTGILFAQQNSLEGLYTFAIIVEELPAVLEEADISRIQLQDRAETYLMDNGIFVSDEEEAYLYVYLQGLEMTNSEGVHLGYSYTLHLSVRQMAYLLRNMNIIEYVTTWSNIQMGVAPGASIGDIIDQALVASVDAFISDYYEANTN